MIYHRLRFGRFGYALFALLTAAGCAGGGAPSIGGGSASRKQDAKTAPVTIRIAVPSATSSNRRKPEYVSRFTQSFSISIVNGAQTYGPFVTNCAGGACVETVEAPIGSDAFSVSLYDQQNATGKLLSSGSTIATIAAGTNNVVSLTFDPVVASATETYTVNAIAGTPTAVPISISALDANGATIVGPGTYETSTGAAATITLSLTDPTGHSTLGGQTSYASPAPAGASPAATLSYDGTPTNFVYPKIGVSINGTATSATTVPLLPSPVGPVTQLVASSVTVNSATRGPDGNIWFAAYDATTSQASESEIGKYNVTSGVVTIYGLATTTAGPTDIVTGGDGNLYFFEKGTTTFGQITTAGFVREFPQSFHASSLVAGVDGNVWFIESGGFIGKITTNGSVTTYASDPVAVSLVAGPQNKMWFITSSGPTTSQIELGSVAGDGTGVALVPVPVLENYNYVIGLVYAPDGNFYSETGTSADSPFIVGYTTSGAVPANACNDEGFGSVIAATLSDGTVLFRTQPSDGPLNAYTAIRPDVSCVNGGILQSGSPTSPLAFLGNTLVGSTPGHAYFIARSTIAGWIY
jgi:hypothetical protein